MKLRGWIIFGVALAALSLAWFMIRQDVDSYDAKYTSCMEYAKSGLPGYRLDYPSKAYDDITRACEKQANQ